MKKNIKKIFLLFLTMIVCLNASVIVFAKSTDYVTIFGEFINHNLDDFLMKNYNAASLDHFRDCYMVDMDNNSVPELLCLFTDDDHGGMFGYAVCIEYDNSFKMGKEIPFDFSDGTGTTLWYRILEQNGKFYFEKFSSSTYVDGRISESEINQTITLNQNGIETIAYDAVLKGVTDFHKGTENYTTYINGQKVEEFDYEYVLNNFNVVADSADYSYNPYTTENVQHSYGKDYAKFWKEQENTTIKVIIDGKEIAFDQQPIIIDGRTLVPLRTIFEELGATVNWDGNTQTVTSTKGQTTISMSIGKTEMYKNGKLITLDVVPQLVGGRTLVPVRAVAEGFDCKVDWDGDSQTVIIKTIDTEKVINIAKNLYQVNEDVGGVTNLATYAEVDALLYNTLNELDVATEYKGVTLNVVSTSTAIAVSGALASKGDFSAVGSIGEEFASLLNSSEVADIIDGSAKDILKGEILGRIDTTVPDINAFVLGLGRTAYDRNSKMILDLIMLHGKFKNNNYTYEDAVAYIVIYDTLILNRKTMSMAVQVLSDELPDNFLESLAMSTESAIMSALKTIIGSKICGRGINIGAELFTDIVTAYADYVCGMGEDFVKYMKQVNHPAINEWINEVEVYNSNLAQKLNIN